MAREEEAGADSAEIDVSVTFGCLRVSGSAAVQREEAEVLKAEAC